MSAAPVMQQQQPGSHPGSASGTPGPAGTPQPLQQPMSNPSMLMQQQQQQQQQQQLPRQPLPDPSKEKLVMSIHEYLILHGAPKAAETLKIEMGPNFPNAKWANSNDPPGFLANWWSLFYDLYCAAPERRNEPDVNATPEAKYFHDYQGIMQSNFPMMNGMPPQFAGPGGMMGPDGMMPGGFAARGFPGRGGGPVGHPGMAPGFMGYDPRMAGRPVPMGAAPGGGRPGQQMTPGSFPVAAMRPPPHMGGQQMPPQGMYRPPFMDGQQGPPGSFAPPHGGMGMNGGVMGMGSPGMQPMQHPGGGPPGFMMMPTSSAPMPPFGSMAPGVSSEGMTGPPSHPSQSAHTPLGNNGPASAGMPGAPLSAGNAGMGGAAGGGGGGGMMNGEMKNSPHTPRGNGGTPGGHGGPGSGAPGSVHSGGAGSVPPPVTGDGITPKQEPMDTNHIEGDDGKSEVEKIKASLISDFNTKDEQQSDYSNYSIAQ